MQRKTPSRSSRKTAAASVAADKEMSMAMKTESPAKKKLVIFLALVLVVGLAVLVSKKYRSLIIVGWVNGQAITRLELEMAMNDRYAKTVFDDLISTTLLKQLATKNEVSVSADELKKEIEATEQRLGGKEALQSTLDRLGYTKTRFEEEMKTQVVVRKLAEKLLKTDITDEEVSKFYADNKNLFPGKKLDEVKLDILQNLKEQKLQQQFATWFQEEKDKAKVQSYL